MNESIIQKLNIIKYGKWANQIKQRMMEFQNVNFSRKFFCAMCWENIFIMAKQNKLKNCEKLICKDCLVKYEHYVRTGEM